MPRYETWGIRDEERGRTKHERRTDSSSQLRGRVADFDLGTQQNVELRMTFHLRLKSMMNRGL